jgi:hypothetical protein
MKKFLVNICLFIAGTIPVYILLVICSGILLPALYTKNLLYNFGGHMQKRLQEVDDYKNVDVLFLGSSHAYRGYDVRLFKKIGLNSFNLGSSAQTPVQTEFLLKKYLHQLNPKFAVLDIYPALFDSDGVESTLDLVSNERFDGNLFSLLINVNDIKAYNTAIYSVYRQLTGKSKTYVPSGKVEKGSRYIPGGFVESMKTSKLKQKYSSSEYHVLPENLKAFNEVISMLKKENIPYILVQAPLYGKRYASIKNTGHIDSLFATYGSYYNFNNIINLPDSAFLDDSHMNQTGVAVFNEKLIEVMEQKGMVGNIKSQLTKL